MLEGGAEDAHKIGAVLCLVIGAVSLYSIGAVSLYSIGVVSLYSIGVVSLYSIGVISLYSIGVESLHSKRHASWARPWPCTVHGHGRSMAKDGPWPWTVHGHGLSMLSMAMGSPWPLRGIWLLQKRKSAKNYPGRREKKGELLKDSK